MTPNKRRQDETGTHWSLVLVTIFFAAGCAGIHNKSVTTTTYESRHKEISVLRLDSLSTASPQVLPADSLVDVQLLNTFSSKENSVTDQGTQNILDMKAPALSTADNQLTLVPSSVEISIENARATTLANNLGLQATLYNPTISKKTIDIERSKFETVFSTSFTWVDNFKADRPGGFLNLQSNVSKSLPLGSQFSLAAKNQTTSVPIGGQDTKVYASKLEATLTQPLLKGFGHLVNTSSILISQANNHRSEAQTKLSVIRLLADLEIVYWEVVAANRELDVQKSQLEIAQKQLLSVEKLISRGIVTTVERNRALSGLLSHREVVVVSKTNLRLRERELKRLLNREDMSLSDSTSIFCTSSWTPLRVSLDRNRLLELAVENRMEMAILELDLLISEIGQQAARNNKLPRLDFYLTHTREGQALGRGDSMENLFKDHRTVDDYILGVSATYPIGNRGAKAAYERADLQRLRTLTLQEDQKQRIRKEILDSVDQLERDWERIVASRAASKAAELTYHAERTQFVGGFRTSTEVLSAASNWGMAQSRENRALADYTISHVYLALATGTMLGFSNVEWTPNGR